ncbi:MAG TPA: 1-acyl-sn-glycerol-3-phosphate acyltransferase, partial [Urbifossiella sp.]
MLGLIRWIVATIMRLVLSLRYRVKLHGLPEVLQHGGPYLILPNHPAYADPPNLLSRLWPYFETRPLFLETNFQNPVLAPFAWLMRGIRVPDTDKASAEARQRAEAAANSVIDALKAGENVIVWPSGRLSRDGREHLGGARTVADVLAAFPKVTVVLVRTRGLWGSMTSYAVTTEKHMPVTRIVLKGWLLWMANLFFFAPRRDVCVKLEAFDAKDRPEPTRESINRWLEDWFNSDLPANESEKPTYVPHHFLFGPRTMEFPQRPPEAELDVSKVKPATKQAVAHYIEEKIKRPLDPQENTAETTFAQLGMDSLDAMEVSLQVEQRFGFTGESVPTKIGQLWALAEGLGEKAPPKPPPPGWFEPPSDQSPLHVDGDTIPAAILNRAFKQRRDLIVADDLAGGVTYEKMIVGAWAMSGQFRDIAAPNIGLMLPASVAGDVALLGVLLAGKLPVLLNWTTGPANLAHAAKIMNLTHVISSKAF